MYDEDDMPVQESFIYGTKYGIPFLFRVLNNSKSQVVNILKNLYAAEYWKEIEYSSEMNDVEQLINIIKVEDIFIYYGVPSFFQSYSPQDKKLYLLARLGELSYASGNLSKGTDNSEFRAKMENIMQQLDTL